MLRASPPLRYETKIIRKKTELVRKQVALAILNTVTDEIFEKRFWIVESEIQKFNTTGTMTFQPVDDTRPITVQVKWWNSFNTYYEIPDHPYFLVIANKYLLLSKNLGSLPERSKKEYTDIVYVPYSKNIETPEIIDSGKQYIEKNIEKAYADLDALTVRSKSTPELPITSAISRDLVRNIMLVEHIDPQQFSIADDHGLELAQRVLAIIGSNRELSYRYTGSPAGANGLAQFIEPTYKTMVTSYPSAKMIKNYSLGMADHQNAVKAMVLFFDSHKKTIHDRLQDTILSQQLGITEEMLAAAYNGGPSRVIRSVNTYGFSWLTTQLSGNTKPIFRRETIDYLKKFQAVQQLLNVF